MDDTSVLPTTLLRWVDRLRERGLGAWALLMVNALEIWGFVGGQVLWMLAPFFDEASLADIAEALESPEAMHRLRAYVVEGDV